MAALSIPALFASYNLWRPTLDASGWAVRPNGPDAGGATGTVVHVDTAGSDLNDGSTELLAVATLDRAWALLKTNNAGTGPAPGNHRLRLKRGQVHEGTFGQPETSGGFVWPGGLSATAPFIIEAYGAGADPIVSTPNAASIAFVLSGDESRYVWMFDIVFRPKGYQDWLLGGANPSLTPPAWGELRGERQYCYFESCRWEGYKAGPRFLGDDAADRRTRFFCMHRCHMGRLYSDTELSGGIYNQGSRSVLFSECTFGECGEWRTHPGGAIYGEPLDQTIYNVWNSQYTLALGCTFARAAHAGMQGRGNFASTYDCFVTECPVPISGGHAQHNDGANADTYRFRGKHVWNTVLGGADVSPSANRGWGITCGFCSDPAEIAWNIVANNTQSTGVAGGLRTDSDDRASDQTQANIDLLACRFHHNLVVNWRMGLEVRYTAGAGAPWRLPAAMRFNDNDFYEADSGSTTVLIGRPQGQGGTWSGNNIGGSGKIKDAAGNELLPATLNNATASTWGTVNTAGWSTATDTTLAKYLESIGYTAPNRNLEGLLAGLRAINRSAWTNNLRGSNINTWVRGRFARSEPNYNDPLGGPLSVTPPPPPPPSALSVEKTVYPPFPLVVPNGTTGLASKREVNSLNVNVSRFIAQELAYVRMTVPTGDDTRKFIDLQVMSRLKTDQGGDAIAPSKNGWVVRVKFLASDLVSLVGVADGYATDLGGNMIDVLTNSQGRCRLEVEFADWAGVKCFAYPVTRAGDLFTVEDGDEPPNLLPSGLIGGGA